MSTMPLSAPNLVAKVGKDGEAVLIAWIAAKVELRKLKK